MIDEPQDRIPVFPLVTNHSVAVAGIRLKDYYTNGYALAQAQLRALELYGHDFISVFSEVGFIAEMCGSEFDYPEDDLPKLRKPLLTSAAEYERLNLPPVQTAGRAEVYYEAIETAYEAVGDRVPILAYVPAPFTTALHLVPAETFLIGLRLNPKETHQLLGRITEVTIQFLKELIGHCGLPMIVDPLASGSVISPRNYQEFALPYERRLIDFLHRYDLDIILHICGNTMPMLGLLPESNADLVSLDRVDLTQAKAVLGNRLRLIGNFDTTRILLAGPAVIEQEVKAMIQPVRDNPKGYVAATGCEVPLRTPAENVRAFVRAAKGFRL